MKRLVAIVGILAVSVGLVLLLAGRRSRPPGVTIYYSQGSFGPIVWITNHTAHTQLIYLDSIQVRTGADWRVYVPAIPRAAATPFRHQTFVAPHSVAQMELYIDEVPEVPGSTWRISASASPQLSGIEERWVRTRLYWKNHTAPLPSPARPLNPWATNTTFYGHHVQLFSQVIDDPLPAQASGEKGELRR